MKHHVTGEIDIYPVGLLADLQRLVHGAEPLRQRLARFRRDLRYPIGRARERKWRAVTSYLNGYLAEPRDWPDGLTRCGTGWTRGRAYRDLNRRVAATKEAR
ncbi:hypothetical protein [Actinomadura sediminis]|uniref:Uncharacterized protein n=1 Tax=Actinomadura sediminis TaxID=1038904 RepID=A0ABW3EUF3_9ACTN